MGLLDVMMEVLVVSLGKEGMERTKVDVERACGVLRPL